MTLEQGRYPVSAGTYYLKLELLFNNAFIVHRTHSGILSWIPILRYWFGTRLIYSEIPNMPQANIGFASMLYRGSSSSFRSLKLWPSCA